MWINKNEFKSLEKLTRESNRLNSLSLEAQKESNNLKREDLETKDRIDISLKAYKEMQSRISELEYYSRKVYGLLEQLGFEFEEHHGVSLDEVIESIDSKSVEIFRGDNPTDFSTSILIRLKCDGLHRYRI